jgi:hypothetical protein
MASAFLFVIPCMLIVMIVVLIPYWFIFKKAGFHPALSILLLIPIANFVMLYVLAFSQWKVVPASQFQATPQPWQPNA